MPTTYQALILAEPSLLSYWPLAETSGTTFADIKATNILTLNAGVTIAAGPGLPGDGGVAPSFNGNTSNGYAATPGAPVGLPTGAAAWTLECWFKTIANNATNYTCFLGYGIEGGVTCNNLYCRSNNASVGCSDWTNNLEYQRPVVFNDGAWHHLVATYTGTTRTLYLDGVIAGPDSPTPNITLGTVSFGVGSAFGPGVGNWNGFLSQCAVYSTALTPASVRTHYYTGLALTFDGAVPAKPATAVLQSAWSSNMLAAYMLSEGTGSTTADFSGNVHTGTLVGGMTWSTQPAGPGLLAVDAGTSPGCYCSIGNVGLAGATSMTFAAYCALNTLVDAPQAQSARMLIGATRAGAGYFQSGIFYNASQQALTFTVSYSTTTNLVVAIPPLNTPVLIVGRITAAGEMSLWYNNIKMMSRTLSSWSYPSDVGGEYAIGGAVENRGDNWSGPIGNAYVLSRGLLDSEVAALAADPSAPGRAVVKLRETQEPVRILVRPTNAKLRETQEPVRVLVTPTNARLRETQVALRVLRINAATVTKPHTIDADLKGSVTRNHGTESVLVKILARSPGFRSPFAIWLGGAARPVNVMTLVHQTDTWCATAVIKTHTTDALLRATQTKTHSTNALLRITQTKPHYADTLLVANNMISHWKLDEPGTGAIAVDTGFALANATDNAGNTTASTTAPVAAPVNFADPSGRFFPVSAAPGVSGIKTYLNAGVQPFHNITKNFTVTAWVRCTGRITNQPFVSHAAFVSSGVSLGWNLVSQQNGLLGFTAGDGTNQDAALTSEFTFSLNVWIHVAAVITDGTGGVGINPNVISGGGGTSVTRYMYFNGRKSVHTDNKQPGASPNVTTYLGKDFAGIDNFEFNGDLDDVRIYNVALTDDQIQSLAGGNDPFITTPVTKNHTTDTYLVAAPSNLISWWKLDEIGTGTTAIDSGTSNSSATDGLGNTTPSTTVPIAAPVNFINPRGRFFPTVSGTKLVTAVQPLHSLTQNFTVAAWVRTSKVNNSPLVTHGTSSVAGGWALSTDFTGVLGFNAYTSGGGNAARATDFVTPTGVWFHVAGVAATSVRYLYLNGRKSVNTNNVMPAASTGVATSLGWDTTNVASLQLNGDLDDVRIYNVALTDDQIQSLAGGNDPFKVVTTTRTHTNDSYVQSVMTRIKSYQTDALIHGDIIRPHYTDSRLVTLTTVVTGHTTDANVKGTVIRTHRTDALARTTFTQTHRTDVLARATFIQTHRTDALVHGTVIKTQRTDTLVHGAVIQTHRTDALVHGAIIQTHGTDAWLSKLGTVLISFNTDADLKGSVIHTHTTDAWIVRPVITVSWVYTTDTLLRRTAIQKHTADALQRQTYIHIHSTNSLQQQAHSRTHDTNALLRQTVKVTQLTDSWIVHTFSVTGKTDILLIGAQTRFHKTGTWLAQVVTTAHTTDTLTLSLPMQNHRTDTLVFGSLKVPNYVSSLLQATQMRIHNTDASTCHVYTVFHQVDSKFEFIRTQTHRTDTYAVVPRTTTHDTDATILRVPEAWHQIDTQVAGTEFQHHTTSTLAFHMPLGNRGVTQRVGTRTPIETVSKDRHEGGNLYPVGFLLVDYTRVAPVLGATPTVQLMKLGSALTPGIWVPAVGVVTEVGNGWYQLAANPADRDVPGEVILMANAPGAMTASTKFDVVVSDPYLPFSLPAAELTAIADVTLTRAFASAISVHARSVIQAIRSLWYWKTTQAQPISIKAEDGTTAWQATVVTDPTIGPIRRMDPPPSSE